MSFFGGRVLGGCRSSNFRSSKVWSSRFGVPDFGAPRFGAPKFGVPSFGPKFGVPSVGIPQIRSSNFSTREFDCSGGRHYKNNGFGISEFRSFGLLSQFRSCASRILVAPYRGILRYYRCADTPYCAILFEGRLALPQNGAIPPLGA